MALPYVTPNQVKPLEEKVNTLEEKVNNKQDALESGVNIKTINNQSILGEGNINISEGTEVIANPTLAGTESNLTGLQVGDTKYKVPQGGGASLGISDDLVFKTDNLKKNIIAYFSQRYPLIYINDETDFILTGRVSELAYEGEYISVGNSFHYIDVNTAISAGAGGSMTYAQPDNMSDFELSFTEDEYEVKNLSLSAGSFTISGTVSDTTILIRDAFYEALNFSETYFHLDDIITLLFYNSSEPNIIGISWQRNNDNLMETEPLTIKDILDCFDVVDY